jgi:hypothetical protein
MSHHQVPKRINILFMSIEFIQNNFQINHQNIIIEIKNKNIDNNLKGNIIVV